MNKLIASLPANAQRGSKPRCHLLTHGTSSDMAARLTTINAPFGVVRPDDSWMPQGFSDTTEAQLHSAHRLLPADACETLLSWWPAIGDANTRTPNWDITTTCTIDGKKGMLLIDAKAYDEELNKEAKGKSLASDASDNSEVNHGLSLSNRPNC